MMVKKEDKHKKIEPKKLSLEEIVRKQEEGLFGKVPRKTYSKGPTIVPIPDAEVK